MVNIQLYLSEKQDFCFLDIHRELLAIFQIFYILFKAGVPNLWPAAQYWAMDSWPVGHRNVWPGCAFTLPLVTSFAHACRREPGR